MTHRRSRLGSLEAERVEEIVVGYRTIVSESCGRDVFAIPGRRIGQSKRGQWILLEVFLGRRRECVVGKTQRPEI